jgi:hypothetical protein
MQKKPDDNVAQYKDRTDCAEDDVSDQIQLPFFWNGVGLVPNLAQFAQKLGVPLIVNPNWPPPSGLLGPHGTVNQSAGTERHGQEQLKEILLPDSFQPVETVSQKKVARYGGCAIRSRWPHRRRIVSIIVIALALPKTAAKKRSPRANARPKPWPASRESAINSRRPGAISTLVPTRIA